jgi:type IV secretory pathway TrbD component
MERPREIVIHQSANRPHLLLGGDRELVLFAALMSAMLIFALVTWWGIVAGIALWIGSVAVLSRMGRFDPMLRQVYVRHVKYRAFYPAKGRLRCETSTTPKAWR